MDKIPDKKPKTREEALEQIRKTMELAGEISDADYQYYLKEVEVYKVSFMDNSAIYVPKNIGEKIKKAMVEQNSSDTITLGKGAWRIYELKSVIPAVIRFAELSEWAQHKMLEEEPSLLDDWYDEYSPGMKRWVDRLRKGEELDNNLKLEKK